RPAGHRQPIDAEARVLPGGDLAGAVLRLEAEELDDTLARRRVGTRGIGGDGTVDGEAFHGAAADRLVGDLGATTRRLDPAGDREKRVVDEVDLDLPSVDDDGGDRRRRGDSQHRRQLDRMAAYPLALRLRRIARP